MRGNSNVLLLAALAATSLVACKPRPAAPPPAAAKPAAPLGYAQTTPDATVKLTLAPAIAAWPLLHKTLYDAGVTELKKDIDTAKADRAHLSGDDLPNPAYEQEITWDVAATTPQLVSLKGTWMSYTGGAHPNSGFNTMIWDTNASAAINRSEVLAAPGAADAGVQAALCGAIKTARAAKGITPSPDDAKMWPCPKWRDTDFVLAQSATPGKFGGLTFVFDPYAIGSYAEGPYELTVPYATVRPVLAPAYAGEFAAGPLKPAPVQNPPAQG